MRVNNSHVRRMDGFGAAGAYGTTYGTTVADFIWSASAGPNGNLGLTIFRSQLWVDTTSGIQGWPQYYQPQWNGGSHVIGDFSRSSRRRTAAAGA